MSLQAAIALTLLATAPATQEPIEPPPPGAPAPDLLAFTTDQDRMTLPVTISGSGPHDFIVDTGAQRTVISRELAILLKLNPGRDVRMTAMTGASNVATVVIPLITVGSLGGDRIEAPALEARNLGADGLLGLDTLQNRALTIDFDRRQMTVTGASKRSRVMRAGSDEIVVTARSVLGQLVVTDAYLGSTKVRVILDTGSAVTVGNLALKARAGRMTMKPISMMSVTGAMLEADYTQIPAIRVGGVTFSGLPVAFADAAPFERFGLRKRPALLLGMDALRMFRRVDIDFPNREVRFALPKSTRRLM